MSLSSLTRFLSLSIAPRVTKLAACHYTKFSVADTLYTHLQKNPTNAEKALSSIRSKLDIKCVNDVLNRCSIENPRLGLRFFVWAGCQSTYRHSSFMYGKACNLFKIRQNPGVVLDLIEAYGVEKCVVSLKTFKVVLNLCRECGLVDEALLVLRKMPEFDVRADTNVYNVVIRMFCQNGDMDMAKILMGEMGLIDLYPDMITYVSMIKGFCNVDRLGEACELLKVMRGHGCVPNVVAYSTILDGVCKVGSMEKALELLGEMEKEGGDCTPNVVTYTSVIQSFCKKGKIIDALGILDRMESCGCAPNRVTASTLVKGLCMDGQLGEAFKLIDRVVAGGSVSYGDCYSSLVVCLLRDKKFEEAERVFRRVLGRGMKLDGLACSIMIKELCIKKRVLDGFHLYDEIEKMGLLSSIDSDIYSTLMVGLCQHGHSMEAAKLARSMLEKRIRLKDPSVEKIVELLKTYGDKELVTKLSSIGS